MPVNYLKEKEKLKTEEEKLQDVKQKLQDQLRRLQVEELALRSMISTDRSEKIRPKKAGKTK